MTDAIVIYWRDIPTQVVIGSGRKAVKRPLADRFLVAVDKAAMADNATSTDAYLEDWRKLPTRAPDLPPDAAAEALASQIEAEYPATRLADLARHGGIEHFD
jgi:hypothetical protein